MWSHMVRSHTDLRNALATITAFYAMVSAKLDVWFVEAEREVMSWGIWRDFDTDTRVGAAAHQVQTVLQGVAIVIVSSIGVVVVDTFDTSFDDPTNTGLSESQEGLLSGFGSMIDLVEPLLVVLMAVVLIAVIQRVQT